MSRRLCCSATRIIVTHNHPSGDVVPSDADIALTRQLRAAGEVLNIPVLDHVICGGNQYTSLRDRGVLCV